VIDDDVNFLEMTGNLLDGIYEVSLAKSGKQALEYLAGGFAPDLGGKAG
jgi:CheY-like chemotaxis protein